jgi:hypothetical protein
LITTTLPRELAVAHASSARVSSGELGKGSNTLGLLMFPVQTRRKI